jgi:hypothetical protein
LLVLKTTAPFAGALGGDVHVLIVQVEAFDADAGQAVWFVVASHVTVTFPDWVKPVLQENVAVLR